MMHGRKNIKLILCVLFYRVISISDGIASRIGSLLRKVSGLSMCLQQIGCRD